MKKWWPGILAILILVLAVFIYMYFFHSDSAPTLADPGSDVGSSNQGQNVVDDNQGQTGSNTSTSQDQGDTGSSGTSTTGNTYDAGTGSGSSTTNQNQVSTDSGGSDEQPEIDLDSQSSIPTDRTVYLIYGRDRAYNREEDSGIEADMVITAVLDPSKSSVDITFIPPNTLMDEGLMLKEIYQTKGISGLKTGVEGLTDLQIDYYIGVDYQPFVQLVDVLKGIEVRLDETIDMANYGLFIHPGINKLDGEETLKLLRLKTGKTTADQRIERQQQVIVAIYQKLNSIRNFTQLKRVNESVLEIREQLETNVDSQQIIGGFQLFKAGLDNFDVEILVGKSENGVWIPARGH